MPTLNTNNLMLVIKARDEAAKVLKSVEGQLQQIVKAAEAANEAMAQIAASGAMESAQNAMAAAQGRGAPIEGAAAPTANVVQTLGNFKADVIAQELGFLQGPLSTIIGKYQELRAEHPLVVGGLTKAGLAANFLGVNAGQLLGPLGDAANIVQVLGGRLTDAGPPFNNMGGRLARIGMAAGTAAAPLGTLASGGLTRLAALGAALIPVIRGVGAALMTVALSPVGLIVTALAGLVAAGIAIWQNWDTISAKATEIWNSISGFLGGVLDGITSKFSEVWNGITSFFSGVWEGLIEIVTENWQKILGVIFPPAGLAMLIAENWGAITETVSEIWGAVVGKVQEWWNSMVGILFPEEGGLVSMITEAWGGLVETVTGIWNGVAGSFTAGVNAVLGAVEGMANGVIQAINAIIRAWNSLQLRLGGTRVNLPFGQSFDIPSITLDTPDLPTISKISLPRLAVGGADSYIPALAAGGIIRRPTLALVGEAGPEAVIPLGRAGMGAPVIQVINRGTIVTERQLEDVIVKAYHRAARLGRI